MNKLQIERTTLTDEKLVLLMSLIQAKLLAKQHTKNGLIDIGVIEDDLTVEFLELCIDNGIEIMRVPFYIELSPSIKDDETPNIFPNRDIPTEVDENFKVISTRVRTVGEYFRYHEKGGRFFIELVKDPKDNPNKPLGTIAVADYLNAIDIKKVYTKFGAAILNKYASMKAITDELASIEEVE